MIKGRCLLFLGLTLLLIISPSAGAQEPEPPGAENAECADARKYLNEGALDIARDIYKKILETAPRDKCAWAGLWEVAKKRCDIANEYRGKGALDLAKKQYDKILETSPLDKCAWDGLLEIAKKRCALGNAYLQEGAPDLARKQYDEILKTSPEDECAVRGLRKVAEDLCQVARRRAESGDLEGAKEIYTEVLKSQRDSPCVVNGLVEMRDNEIEGRLMLNKYNEAWEKWSAAIEANPDDQNLKPFEGPAFRLRLLSNQATEIWKWAKALLIILGVFLLVRFLVKWLWSEYVLRLDINDFVVGSAVLNADSKAGPDAKTALVARFEECLSQLCQACEMNEPYMIDGPLERPELPDLSSMPKEAKALMGIVTKLLPPNVVTIKGSLEYEKEKGAGLYVKVIHSRNNALWKSYTVWRSAVEQDFKASDGQQDINDYVRLVEFAAIMAYWEISRRGGTCLRERWSAYWHMKGCFRPLRNFLFPSETIKLNKMRRTFGTGDVQSYIRNRLAMRADGGNDERVKELLRGALAHDHKNYVALFNLAKVEFREANRAKVKNYKEPEKGFQKVQSLTEEFKHNRAYTLSHFWLGIIELHRKNFTKAKKLLGEAKTQADRFLGEQLSVILEIPFLCASALAAPEEIEEVKGKITKIEDEGHTAPPILYNLACLKSRMIDAVSGIKDKQTLQEEALKYLEAALTANRNYAESAQEDPAFKPVRDMDKRRFDELLTKEPQERRKHMAAVRLDTGKGIPTVKIKVANIQPATYKSWLRLPGGAEHNLGNDNEIDLSTAPGINSTQDLIDKTFIWDVRVVNATGGSDEKYHVSVSIFQDGVPICDAIVKEGKFDGNAAWCSDSATFY